MGLSVFQRLQEAVSASESIPDIIAEIDAMLPKGYFVSKTLTDIPESIGAPIETAEDMSDWRNWQVGDVLEAAEDVVGHLVRGGQYVLRYKSGMYVYVGGDDYRRIGWLPGRFRFHSRPAKVAE